MHRILSKMGGLKNSPNVRPAPVRFTLQAHGIQAELIRLTYSTHVVKVHGVLFQAMVTANKIHILGMDIQLLPVPQSCFQMPMKS